MQKLLLKSGLEVLLDDEDFNIFKNVNWTLNDSGYVVHKSNGRTKFLHKEIVKQAFGYVGLVDHKDRVLLNNQKQNLRPATQSQNNMNRGPKQNSTGFKGVNYCARNNKYLVQIMYRGTVQHLGYYADVTLAAKAYDKAAKQYHGDFAYFNFPEDFDGTRIDSTSPNGTTGEERPELHGQGENNAAGTGSG